MSGAPAAPTLADLRDLAWAVMAPSTQLGGSLFCWGLIASHGDAERLAARIGEGAFIVEVAATSNTVMPVVHAVLCELYEARRKFPTWPTDPLHALAVLGEEFGELTKDVLQLTYEPHKTSRARVRREALQTAAMALRFAASLDHYDYRPSAQHRQDMATR